MEQIGLSKKEKIFNKIFLLLTTAVVIGIFIFNFNSRPFYNGDIYSDAMVAKEMWKDKTLFPENWVFGNQFYVAATPVLAALMYGILGDSFLALSTVQSSKRAPNAMIHATSPAAKISPIKSDATIAIAIRSADEIHFSRISLVIARSSIGIPLIITVPHAGFK